ncbi:MAG: HEPN domain-containing protein [Cytophagales bacterium]|nr:HEPN domain-containing protein [Cytophagales bacterium]
MDKKSEIVKEWINKAEHDLEIAELALEHKPHLTDNICFHCQQTAEKYIKAYLVSLNIDFKEIHDLYYLLDLISNRKDFNDDLYNCIDKFENFAVEVRYPGDSYEPSLEDAKTAYQTAVKVKNIILELITK